MPKLLLSPHSDSRSPIGRIEVEFARDTGDLLRLTYRIFGVLDQISIPPAQPSARVDELWKGTCFEAFLGTGRGYYEFNLSPSAQWAAYRFDGYRAGMRDIITVDPSIAWEMNEEEGVLAASFQLPTDATGPLGLSAVIEDKDGGKAYWALAHPAGPPDFHHAACFAASLPPAG